MRGHGGSRGPRVRGAEGRAERRGGGGGRESGPGGRSGPREPVSCRSGRVVSSVGPGGGRAGGPERADGLENSRRAEGLSVEQGQSRDLARGREMREGGREVMEGEGLQSSGSRRQGSSRG